MRWYTYCMTHSATLQREKLDQDQAAALCHFMDDLGAVLREAKLQAPYSQRLLSGLAAAYHAALGAGNWNFFIAILSCTLDDLEDGRYAPRSRAASQFWRLRAMVRENADLLPPEMLRIS